MTGIRKSLHTGTFSWPWPFWQMQEARTRNIRFYISGHIILQRRKFYSLCFAQVGACLVTPSPHRLVAMGYNGMPDGRGFKDERMDWGFNQKNYSMNQFLHMHTYI